MTLALAEHLARSAEQQTDSSSKAAHNKSVADKHPPPAAHYTHDMSQYWSEAKKGVAYPPIQPRKAHAERARPMPTRVTELLGIE